MSFYVINKSTVSGNSEQASKLSIKPAAVSFLRTIKIELASISESILLREIFTSKMKEIWIRD